MNLTQALTALALRLAGTHSSALAERGREAAEEVAMIETDEARARAILTWSKLEAQWWTDPKGDNDHSEACGATQMHVGFWRDVLPEVWTCEALRSDRLTAYWATSLVLDHLVRRCGSLASALGAYSGGTCGAAPELVKRRCRMAGLTDRCTL